MLVITWCPICDIQEEIDIDKNQNINYIHCQSCGYRLRLIEVKKNERQDSEFNK